MINIFILIGILFVVIPGLFIIYHIIVKMLLDVGLISKKEE